MLNTIFLLNQRGLINIDIQIPLISRNKNYAIIYELDNPNGLSGGGNLILLKLENNKWKIIGTLYSWIA